MSKLEAAARAYLDACELHHVRGPLELIEAHDNLRAALTTPPPSEDARSMTRDVVQIMDEAGMLASEGDEQASKDAYTKIDYRNQAALTAAEARGRRAGMIAAAEIADTCDGPYSVATHEQDDACDLMAKRIAVAIRAEADKC